MTGAITQIKLFLTRIIWGRRLTIVESNVLSGLDRKMDNVIVISRGDNFVLSNCAPIGRLTFISGTLRNSDVPVRLEVEGGSSE